MSALAAPSIRPIMEEPTIHSYPVAENVKCYQGGLAVLAAGKARPGYVATGLVAVGIFDPSGPDSLDGIMDNTGGAADAFNVRVRSGIFRFANLGADPVVAADVGKPCYIFDDNTVAHSDGTGARSVAGVVAKVETAGVWVQIGSVDGTALAAEITAREAITTDLASTADGKGAALIGVENDPTGKITATTVQGALMESIDGRRIATVADDATLAGALVVHAIAVPATASSTKAITLNAAYGKLRILDVHFIKKGTTGSTTDAVKLTDGTDDITDSLALDTKAAGAIVRAASIDPTKATLAAGATLVANWTKDAGGTAEGTLVITGVRSA